MTGLENILSQIQSDAQKEAEDLLSAAKTEAAELKAAAQAQADEKAQELLKDGERRAQAIRERAESAAQLERRGSMLAFKQKLIGEAVDQARASLENAPAEEYFPLLLGLVSRFAKSGKAQMHLNSRDLGRLPTGFEESLKKAAPQADIQISREPGDMAGGFLLTYEGVDINCTFQAIFEDAEGQLRDAAAKALFPQEETE